jgi:glycosyltransferase involved in cell wall biosynthesis
MIDSPAAPRVSVIIPTYNRAHILPRALTSVLEQGLSDLEVIVVDDGSADRTAEVVAQISDPRVRYAPLGHNRGIGAARHEGIARARGDLVAFLDSDDLWKPGKLEKMAAAFERLPEVDLIFSDYEDINYIQGARDHGFGLAGPLLRALKTTSRGDGVFTIEEGVPETLLRGNFVGTSSVVTLRRTVFDRAGNFREDLSGPEDLEFWWRAAVLGARFAYTTDILVERHKDSDSITARKRAFAPQRLRALDACEATARAHGRPDLLAHLRRARAHTCVDLIEACAHEGQRLEAGRAFLSSLRFGLSAEAVKYLGAALLGPALVSALKRRRVSSSGAGAGPASPGSAGD